MGKPQHLQMPVPSLKEQLAGVQVTETESVLCPTPPAAPIGHPLSAWLYLPGFVALSVCARKSARTTINSCSPVARLLHVQRNKVRLIFTRNILIPVCETIVLTTSFCG